MELEHRFSVPVPAAQAWDVLLDVERIAPCMPGATVESFDGETIEGRAKLKVGPVQVTYTGTAMIVEKDEAARRAVIDATAKEARGSGTATATITAVLTDAGGCTDVLVTTDLQITGKPAQFGRGVLVEVGNKLLGKFADCLADELSGKPAAAAPGTEKAAAVAGIAEATTAAGAQATTAPPPLRRVPEEEAVDLPGTAGPPVLKRVLPVVGAVVVALVVRRLVSRRR